ncbi:hypothetical protein [Actinoallomurus liliacearum]
MADDRTSLPDLRSVPEPVSRLAAGRMLGDYLGRRGWGDPRKKIGLSLLAILTAVVGEILVVQILGFFFLHLVMLMLFIGGISNAIAALARGRQENYLFARGLVHSKNDELRTVEWPQVARLGSKAVGGHGLTGGRHALLHLQDGGSIKIPLTQQAATKDPFIQNLVHLLKEHGRPIE